MSVTNPDCDALAYLLNATTRGGVLPKKTVAVVCEYGDSVFGDTVTLKVWKRTEQQRTFAQTLKVDCMTATELAQAIGDALIKNAEAGALLVIDRRLGEGNEREMSCADGHQLWTARYRPT